MSGRVAAVHRLQDQGHHARRLLDPANDPVRPQHAARVHPGLLVQLGLLGNQHDREQPVHLGPGRGDLRRDRLAEHLGDCADQVLADDQVLLRGDAQRDVLVGDPGPDMVERRRVRVDQADREGDDRRRESLALLTGGLVALVEHAQQFRVRGEHARVEDGGDGLGVRGNHGRGRLDDGLRLGREQRLGGGFRQRGQHWPPEGDCEPPPRRAGDSTGVGTKPCDSVGARYRTTGPKVPSGRASRPGRPAHPPIGPCGRMRKVSDRLLRPPDDRHPASTPHPDGVTRCRAAPRSRPRCRRWCRRSGRRPDPRWRRPA